MARGTMWLAIKIANQLYFIRLDIIVANTLSENIELLTKLIRIWHVIVAHATMSAR